MNVMTMAQTIVPMPRSHKLSTEHWHTFSITIMASCSTSVSHAEPVALMADDEKGICSNLQSFDEVHHALRERRQRHTRSVWGVMGENRLLLCKHEVWAMYELH